MQVVNALIELYRIEMRPWPTGRNPATALIELYRIEMDESRISHNRHRKL